METFESVEITESGSTSSTISSTNSSTNISSSNLNSSERENIKPNQTTTQQHNNSIKSSSFNQTNQTNQTNQVNSKLKLNEKFLEFMNTKLNRVVEDYFEPDRYPKLNVRIKNNYFALDAVGIPIRLKERDRKSALGWYRHGDLFLHHAVDPALLEIMPKEDVMIVTLRKLKVNKASESDMTKALKKEYGDDILEKI